MRLIYVVTFLLVSFGVEAKDKGCSKKELSSFNSRGAGFTKKADFYTCLHKKGAYSASVPFLTHLISRSSSAAFQNKYLKVILPDFPREYEAHLYKKLFKKVMRLESDVQSDLMYFLALHAQDKGHFREAQKFLSRQKGENFSRYAQSRFLKGVVAFKRNWLKTAEKEFTFLAAGKFQAPTKDLKSKIIGLSALNLARLKMKQGKYSEAIDYYRSVSFDHSDWFDGLVEMSWVMLAKGDYEGAIGNVDFVDKSTNPHTYKPWIPLARAIGLLKLCRYPEARDAIEIFKTNYGVMRKDARLYLARNSRISWYSRAVEILDSKITKSSTKKIPSLAYYSAKTDLLVRKQERINFLLDEEDNLKSIRKKLNRNRGSFAYKFVNDKLRQMNKKITDLENSLGKDFKNKFNATLAEQKRLERVADIVDYEIFARSSDSITNRVAGTKFKDKMKKIGRKKSSWIYVGEFWADEVGRFRSLLKNKCVDKSYKVSKK